MMIIDVLVCQFRLFYEGTEVIFLPPLPVFTADYRSVSDAAEPSQQTKRSQQSAFPFPPGGRWDGGQIRR